MDSSTSIQEEQTPPEDVNVRLKTKPASSELAFYQGLTTMFNGSPGAKKRKP